MNDILRQKITSKLRAFLNREPTENEIVNGQTDSNLRQWISQDDVAAQQQSISQLQATTQKLSVQINPTLPLV